MSKQEHWSVKKFRELRPALNQYTGATVTQMVEAQDGMEISDLILVEAGVFFAPEPIGLAHLYQRGPYANPGTHTERLEGACQRGWLDKKDDNVYIPSQKGIEVYEGFLAAYKEALASVESLPADQLEGIVAALSKVVQAASKNSRVMHKPGLDFTMKETLPTDASNLQRIQLYCEQMLAYRDDAHVAAWSPHKIEGIIWESLSDVWEESAGTPADMAEKRPFRGFDEKDYRAAFAALVKRGWIEKNGEGYRITEEGRQLREQAEDLTNQYYDAPWDVLNAEGQAEVKVLFQLLLDKHQPEPEQA